MNDRGITIEFDTDNASTDIRILIGKALELITAAARGTGDINIHTDNEWYGVKFVVTTAAKAAELDAERDARLEEEALRRAEREAKWAAEKAADAHAEAQEEAARAEAEAAAS